jgi:hypothetical protein
MNETMEYVEWHLTAEGWVRGSEHTAFGGTLHFEPPRNRVLTYRWISEAVSGATYQRDRLEEQWRSGDQMTIQRLLVRFGDVRRLGYHT